MPEIINKSQIKIIENVLTEPGASVREIIRKTNLSPNYVLDSLNFLIRRGILKEEQLKKGKRVYLRRFYFNFKPAIAKHYFSLLEEEKKAALFTKYPYLKPVLEQLAELLERKCNFILIYGSYARFAAEKDSDIDILIVGNIKDREKIREIFVSLPIEVSLKIETMSKFKKRASDSLHQQLLKEHITIYDSGDFVDSLMNLSKKL